MAKNTSAISGANHLRNIAAGLQQKLKADLSQSAPIKHAGTKGDGTESVWVSLFNNYLPIRFRASKGIIIDYSGQTSEQIDCIIFDSQFTPQIIPNKDILHIPAEAVHAIFEVKQVISKGHIEYAVKKAESVRKLARTSAGYTGDGKNRRNKPQFRIMAGLLASSCKGKNGFNANFVSNLNNGVGADLDFIFSMVMWI